MTTDSTQPEPDTLPPTTVPEDVFDETTLITDKHRIRYHSGDVLDVRDRGTSDESPSAPTATYENIFEFSPDVPETVHHGHAVEVGKRRENGEPGNVEHDVTCLVDGAEFVALADEVMIR